MTEISEAISAHVVSFMAENGSKSLDCQIYEQSLWREMQEINYTVCIQALLK